MKAANFYLYGEFQPSTDFAEVFQTPGAVALTPDLPPMEIKKVLVANRGEIAIRIFRACVELNLRTVGIYTYEDRYSQHRYKADEAYQVGEDDEALKPYLDSDAIIEIALQKGVNAIHPGYGFLSENAEFAKKCRENGLIFIGPDASVMQKLGDKIEAKKIARACEVPIIESNQQELTYLEIALDEAERIGYPLMLKAAAGGGGRGMRVLRSKEDLVKGFPEARREAENAFGDGTLFLEKFVEDPKHIEVQIVGDHHGNIVHLFERDCSVQRRYQKVIEVAPAISLDDETRQKFYDYALRIARHVNYNNIGTVEFLLDRDNNIYFIEVNPRIQVEHTVTEIVTGIDLVKAQIFIAGGYKLSDPHINIPSQEHLSVSGVAIQCRITTEDPENNFQPDYGIITTYRSAGGFGVRLDAGSVYQGVKVSPFFDSMLVKVSATDRTMEGAARKMKRAITEFRIRGVKTNISFLLNILNHPTFIEGKCTVNFVASEPELLKFRAFQDRATRIVQFLGETTVNGNPDVTRIDPNVRFEKPVIPHYDKHGKIPEGTKDLLTKLGRDKFTEWLKNEKKIHYTDCTFRDAHQSLLATRVRTTDILPSAHAYAHHHPEVFSLEVWGGATFDVCLRFLGENPWRRLQKLREAVPNILLQMLLRGSNGVGYTAYPDNLIEAFIEKSWENGVDIFRVFDSLNWIPAMEPSIRAINDRTGGLAEAAIGYTGDITDKSKTKYNLKYYLQLAKDLENAGAHILAIKDMAGLLKPYAAAELVTELKNAVKIPIHLHTHDTSGLQVATYLKAIEAGVDVIDVALASMSGLTSQPNFNSILEMMQFHERENPINKKALQQQSNYWEAVRQYYYPFESGLQSSTAEVFDHEIPGGQYSNLKPQAVALGLGDRFEEVKKAYTTVNQLFGDIVKVTPSSKVVGDMAQFMVTNNLTEKDIFEKGHSLSFPESVKGFFKGELGQPAGGFPAELQSIILKGEKPITDRPNAHMAPIDLEKEFAEFKRRFEKNFVRTLEFTDYLSWRLYPKVMEDAIGKFNSFGDMSKVPTKNFFYGMKLNEECIIEIGPGKVIIVELLSIGNPDKDGVRTLFFKVNGQTRSVTVADKNIAVQRKENAKADPAVKGHIGAPLQGLLSKILAKEGEVVKKNEPLFVIEAMKMETTVTAPADMKVLRAVLGEKTMVESNDLVIEGEEA
jgi:pyruvate carboxylase